MRTTTTDKTIDLALKAIKAIKQLDEHAKAAYPPGASVRFRWLPSGESKFRVVEGVIAESQLVREQRPLGGLIVVPPADMQSEWPKCLTYPDGSVRVNWDSLVD